MTAQQALEVLDGERDRLIDALNELPTEGPNHVSRGLRSQRLHTILQMLGLLHQARQEVLTGTEQVCACCDDPVESDELAAEAWKAAESAWGTVGNVVLPAPDPVALLSPGAAITCQRCQRPIRFWLGETMVIQSGTTNNTTATFAHKDCPS